MGLFTLAACSEDAYQSAEEQNAQDGSQYQTNSFNENDPGNTHGDDYSLSGEIWKGADYYSPWDIWYRVNNYGDGKLQPNYIFSTIHTGEKEGVSNNYTIEIYAYVGLAYFDGINDGTYADVATAPTIQYNLASGFYPNLYAGNNEVGNLIKTDVITVQPNESIRLEDTTLHLLTNLPSAQDKYPLNSGGQFFGFSGITPQEEDLLSIYGKVFFYEVVVYDASIGSLPIAHEFMQLNPRGYPSGSMPASNKTKYWEPVNDLIGNQITGNAPGGLGSYPLYYLNSSLTTGNPGGVWEPSLIPGVQFYSDSREVIFDFPVNMHSIPLTGSDKLVLDVLGSSRYGWLNSSIYLHLE